MLLATIKMEIRRNVDGKKYAEIFDCDTGELMHVTGKFATHKGAREAGAAWIEDNAIL